MIGCPVCQNEPATTNNVGSNCFRCDTCNELVFAIKNPVDPSIQYAAISNAAGQIHDVPDDILRHNIVDQSPISDAPRNMIIEFDDGASVIIIQPLSDKSKYTKRTRKSLDKTAFALKRNLLYANLPVELMDQIRNSADGENGE